MQFERKNLTIDQLLEIYRQLVYPRLIEEKMLKLLRQGRISKWFSGIGQEAISVGSTMALRKGEFIFPLHRNLGVFTVRGMPLDRLFAQWQGKASGYTKGRDRSFHFGSLEHHIVGMISHLGPQLTLANGAALAGLLKNENTIALAFTGEGGTSEGDFHEALNVAAVWKLPVIFIIENNGYGLSTPAHEQYACRHLVDRAAGYGMEGVRIDGNNVLEVFHTVSQMAEDIRVEPKPVLVECMTYRMRGHEEASGTKYVPKSYLEEGAARDPVANYEKWLLDQGFATQDELAAIRNNFKAHIQSEVEKVFAWPDGEAIPEAELADVYMPFEFKPTSPNMSDTTPMRFIDAIKDGLRQAMIRHPDLVLMGQDIAEYGGVFKITEGFAAEFGKQRVRNTPLCESAIIGAAMGLSLKNIPSMVEMQFADFVTCGFNQIVNNLAKAHYRWGKAPNVVIRMPCGAETQAGPFHSQTNEAWFAHVPGLKIVYPSTAFDAKGLLLTCFEDPNPVLFFEHKALYRRIEDPVPKDYYTLPLGQARVVRQGTEMTIVCYGLAVLWVTHAVQELAIDAEVIDLRCLVPLDYETIYASLKKTGKLCIVHEDTLTGGLGGEWSAHIQETMFEALDAPIVRCGSLDTPIPFAKRLEDQFLAKARLKEKLRYLREY